MNDIQAQIKKQDETISLLRGLLEQMKAERTPANSSNSNINVNAGGIGVWIATTACLIAVTCCGFMAIISIDQGRKIDRLEDYVQSIFRISPALQKQLEAEQSKKEK